MGNWICPKCAFFTIEESLYWLHLAVHFQIELDAVLEAEHQATRAVLHDVFDLLAVPEQVATARSELRGNVLHLALAPDPDELRAGSVPELGTWRAPRKGEAVTVRVARVYRASHHCDCEGTAWVLYNGRCGYCGGSTK